MDNKEHSCVSVDKNNVQNKNDFRAWQDFQECSGFQLLLTAIYKKTMHFIELFMCLIVKINLYHASPI